MTRSARFYISTLLALAALVVVAPSARAQAAFDTPGDQTYTVLQTGLYTLVVTGADGSGPDLFRAAGGSGATVRADIFLQAGDELLVVVGGHDRSNGGGGSAVVQCGNPRDCAAGTLLLVAGGGGGGGDANGRGGVSADGTPTRGAARSDGGGGGGFNAPGQNWTGIGPSWGGGGAGTLTGGGVGGRRPGIPSRAFGFGGGGGGDAGGGGGYGGGDGGARGGGGEGGTSFAAPGATNVVRIDGMDGGAAARNGRVVISLDLVVDTDADDQPYDATTSRGECTDGVLDGDCTLREAIQVANDNDGTVGTLDLDTIVFEITAANGAVGGVATIEVGPAALPALTNAGTTIDGTTQTPDGGITMTSPNTAAEGSNAVLLVELDGTNAGAGASGFTVEAADVTIRGLAIGGFDANGVVAETGADGFVLEGNFIGLGADGQTERGNGNDGVRLTLVDGPRIGTDGDGTNDLAERNVIGLSGQVGITILANDAVVAGNVIGLAADGVTARANGFAGVNVNDAFGGGVRVRIGTNGDGTSDLAERNVVSGNGPNALNATGAGLGVLIQAVDAVVAGNLIGLAADGVTERGNANTGVAVIRANSRIGSDGDGQNDEAERNVIAGNGGSGNVVLNVPALGAVVRGNYIGTDATGDALPGADGGPRGVFVFGPDAQILGNVVSGHVRTGIEAVGTQVTGLVVQGNTVGLGADGTTALGNASAGIQLFNGPTGALIGTDGDGIDDTAESNVVGSNGSGVILSGSRTMGNRVAGNTVGLTVAGDDRGHDAYGITVNGASDNVIGGTEPGEGNTIGFDALAGIRISGNNATGNRVVGNAVGTNAAGDDLGGDADGIVVQGAPGNRIGGLDAGEANTVANNGGTGILVIGNAATSNALLGNAVFDNANLGIDLDDDGVTANDPDDPDDGPNELQNYPTIVTAFETSTGATVSFILDSNASTDFRVELFVSDAADGTGFGEGARFLGAATVTTDGDGDASGALAVTGVDNGDVITATATPIDTASPTGFGGTSEFSAAATVLPSVSFATATLSSSEGSDAILTLSLSAPAQGGEAVEVVFASGDPASADSDDLSGFTSETVTFTTGQTTATVAIPIADDGEGEEAEAFQFRLRTPSGLTLGDPTELVLTVDPSSARVAFAVAQTSRSEGAARYELELVLSDQLQADGSVEVVLVDGNPADLGGFSSRVVSLPGGPAGPISVTVEIPITDDSAVEPSETFVFELRDASGNPPFGLALGLARTALIVLDDDGEPLTVTVAQPDADGGPFAFAVPVNGLTSVDIATVAGADSVYVVGPDGALVAASDRPLPAGTLVVVDVAPNTVLTFSGSTPMGTVSFETHDVAVGDETRVLVPVGNPTGRTVDLDAVLLTGGTLADVALVFDREAGAFRPVSLAGLGDDLALGPYEVVVLQVQPTESVSASVRTDAADAPDGAVRVARAPFSSTDGETAVVLVLRPRASGMTARRVAREAGDTVVLRLGVGENVLDAFDGLDVTSPLGATLAADDGGALAALSLGEAVSSGPVTVSLTASMPGVGSYEIAWVSGPATVGPRPVTVEIVQGGVATTVSADEPVALTTVEDLAVRVSLGTAVAADDEPTMVAALSVFPNPSAGRATVSLAMSEAGKVRVSVYDALGREVTVLHNGAASGELRLAVEGLSPGAYVVRAQGAGVAQVRGLTVAR